jgi:serine/threonine-protein kinase
MSLRIGETFAGYRVLRLLGSGGMGDVYLVQHPHLPRHDALKVLRPDVSSDSSFRDRFIREADLAASLRHPHIVGVHDRGEHDGQLWIAMEYIDGTDAAQLLQQRYPAGMPAELALPIVSAIASALDYAHKKGLLHRDVKPANIIVSHFNSKDEEVTLADFGIARPLDETGSITTTDMTVGTVAYAAPEQLMGEHMDGRADQYALAATTYHLLCGAQLFPHSNPAVVISRHLNTTPPTLGDHRPDCAALDAVLQIALAKSPQDRFPSSSAFAEALVDESRAGQGAASTNASTRAAPKPDKSATASPKRSPAKPATTSRRRSVVLGCIAAIMLLIGVVTLVWRPWQQARQQPSTSLASPTTTPMSLTGEWSGPVSGGQSGFDVVAEIVDGAKLTGTVSYPQLSCSGTWTQHGSTANGVRLITETITRGNCVTSDVTLTPHSDGTLSFMSTYYAASKQQDITAYATLRRVEVPPSPPSVLPPPSPAVLPPHARVEVAGHIQYNGDDVQCVSANGQFSIGVGLDPNMTGIGAILTDAAGSRVTSVAVGDVNGDIYGFAPGVPGAYAVATNEGNAYIISGTVTDLANPGVTTSKQFQMNVTCPT